MDEDAIDQLWPTIAQAEDVLREWSTCAAARRDPGLDSIEERTLRRCADRALRQLRDVAEREARLEVLDAVLARAATSPWPLRTGASRRVLAWPEWTADELCSMFQSFLLLEPAAPRAALCVRLDARRDGRLDAKLPLLQAAYEKACPARPEIELVVLEESVPDAQLARLGLAIEGWVPLASSTREPRRSWLAALASHALVARDAA
jgi:hypothetical protein